MSKIYRHYGSEFFDYYQYNPIKNIGHFSKPSGGFWGSPKDSYADWYSWCLENDFNTDKLDLYFDFFINDDSKVIEIESHKDFIKLRDDGFAIDNRYLTSCLKNDIVLDYEKLLEYGYDAIEVFLNDETYWDLYGWDCDSILIMNPKIIVPHMI